MTILNIILAPISFFHLQICSLCQIPLKAHCLFHKQNIYLSHHLYGAVIKQGINNKGDFFFFLVCAAEDPQKHITSLRSPEKVQGAAHSTWSSYASSDVTDGKDSPVCNVVGGNSKANERQWRRQFCHHSRSGCHGRDFGIVEHTISRERDASMVCAL